MNYYEYAPLAFRWLSLTPIKPWNMFAFLWIVFAIMTFKLFLVQRKLKKTQPEKRKTRFFIGLCAWIMLLNLPILDMYYMDSEFNNALARPGIWIKRQVEANGYAEGRSNADLTNSEIKTLGQLKAKGDEDYWVQRESKDCTDNINKYGYEYKEKFRLSREKEPWIQSNPLEFEKTFDYLDENREIEHNYVSKYDGIKEGQCVYGLLNKPYSRYWVIEEYHERVGYGLFRKRTLIVDTWTGEEIAHRYTFQKSGHFLRRITVGLLGNAYIGKGNVSISMPDGQILRDYYIGEKRPYSSIDTPLITNTLIPSKSFNKK